MGGTRLQIHRVVVVGRCLHEQHRYYAGLPEKQMGNRRMKGIRPTGDGPETAGSCSHDAGSLASLPLLRPTLVLVLGPIFSIGWSTRGDV